MPVRTYIQSERGPRGLATVKVLPKTVQVEMDITDEVGRIKHRVIEVPRSGAPEDVRNGEFVVSLNATEDRIYSAYPPGGKGVTYLGVYHGLQKRANEMAQPRNDPGRTYSFNHFQTGELITRTEPQSRVFTMEFRVVNGEYAGAVMPLRLRFLFARFEDTNEAMVWAEGDDPFPRWARELDSTLRTAGIDYMNDTIPYSSDGIVTLKWLDEVLKDRKKIVRLHAGKSGWINYIRPAEEGLTLEQFDKPVKKTRKKAAKK